MACETMHENTRIEGEQRFGGRSMIHTRGLVSVLKG